MNKILFIFIALILSAGCSLFNKPQFNYPSDIWADSHNAKNESERKIKSIGVSLESKKGCTLKKHPGEKRIGGWWCWITSDWDLYVGGLCWGTRIEIGCNPITGGETVYVVNEHEHAHYWLITNYGDYGHDPKYKSLFVNWNEPRVMTFAMEDGKKADIKAQIRQMYLSMKEGSVLSVNLEYPNGDKCHIDFVVSKDAKTIE